MNKPQKVLIIAPYWQNPQHLGTYRVDRFVRWLADSGAAIVLVAGGPENTSRQEAWGRLVTVRDTLGVYRERKVMGEAPRARNPVLRLLAYALLLPDPGILWALRAVRNSAVHEFGADADIVLSSSFPESTHVAAYRLAKRFGAAHIVDMRDGWLDEPMKPFLRESWVRRLLEGCIERRILRHAKAILVTSLQWKELLVRRLPFTAAKTIVLTNACPRACVVAEAGTGTVSDDRKLPFTLVYAGRIFSSRAERRVEHLLSPLLAGLQQTGTSGRLLFVGNLGASELKVLSSWRDAFFRVGWEIETEVELPRASALALMCSADGLLLLSSSHASIPAKLFDYLVARRPVLALTVAGGAVAGLAPRLPQLFVLDYEKSEFAKTTVKKFLDACSDPSPWDVPAQFEEPHLRTIFLKALDCAGAKP